MNCQFKKNIYAVTDHTNTGIKNNQCIMNPLMPGTSREIVLVASDDFLLSLQGQCVELSFNLENLFTKRYKETIKMIVAYISKQEDDAFSCTLSFQNFHLYRIENHEGSAEKIEEIL